VKEKRTAAYRQGIFVFLALALLTGVEFTVSSMLENAAVILIVIGLIKAGLIVQFFMHIYRLWREEDH
jgi:cytochrome c oxidase subunit IV